MHIPSNIIISRTDSIGDVILTLPVAKVLKQYFPGIKIGFIGKAYTKPVIEACTYVDEFIDMNDFLHKKVNVCGKKPEAIIHVLPRPELARRAKQLRIPIRIGTRNRLYHWATCNRLVKLSRKNSDLHEAQLNIILLRPLGIKQEYPRKEIGGMFGLENLIPLPENFAALINNERYNLVLHPKSQGNGREWPLNYFIQLIKLLDHNKYNLFVSGTGKDGEQLRELFSEAGNLVTDITGQMSLQEFMSFINRCDGLLASGTGPLHIAAALEKDALGLYPPLRPVHIGRWEPLGKGAKVFVTNRECFKCNKPSICRCMMDIQPATIKASLDKLAETKLSE